MMKIPNSYKGWKVVVTGPGQVTILNLAERIEHSGMSWDEARELIDLMERGQPFHDIYV